MDHVHIINLFKILFAALLLVLLLARGLALPLGMYTVVYMCMYGCLFITVHHARMGGSLNSICLKIAYVFIHR